MSCNQPLYQEEEQACRDTFLKDAEGAGLSYYFYKGTDGELSVNQESHTMLLPVSDGLGATSKKTVMALVEALKMDDWDYVLKTNVSTWLDVQRIVKAVDKWEGAEDRNIYGARFLVNNASMNVPFPRGHFTVLSRFMVRGIVEWAPKLISVKGMPKTDDTLICLAALYYLQRVLKDDYKGRLMEVPSVNTWQEALQDAQDWSDALSVRCKDEKNRENAPDNMRKVHKLKHSKSQSRMYRRPMGVTETKYGVMSYEVYEQFSAAIEQLKKYREVEKQPEPQKQEPEKENKIERIRKLLAGK